MKAAILDTHGSYDKLLDTQGSYDKLLDTHSDKLLDIHGSYDKLQDLNKWNEGTDPRVDAVDDVCLFGQRFS